MARRVPVAVVMKDDAAATPAPARGALRARILSALVLAPLALFCVWAGGAAFALLIALAVIVMIHEWSSLSEPGAPVRAAWPSGVVLLALVACAALARIDVAAGLGLAGLAVVAGAALLRRAAPLWPPLGLLYLGVPAVALVWLRASPQGAAVVLWTLLLVWAVDIGAYAVGRTLGGPRLAPRISPGKTWSGLFGGMAAGGLAGGAAGFYLGLGPAVGLAGLGAGLAVLEQMGDLAESAFKRRWHAKDAGNLIPGHGGLLDRLDGLLAVAPAIALLVWWRLAQGGTGLL